MNKKKYFWVVVFITFLIFLAWIENRLSISVIPRIWSSYQGFSLSLILNTMIYLFIYVPQLMFLILIILGVWIFRKRKDIISIIIAIPSVGFAIFILYSAVLVPGYNLKSLPQEPATILYLSMMSYYGSLITFCVLIFGVVLGILGLKENRNKRLCWIGAMLNMGALILNVISWIWFWPYANPFRWLRI